MVIRNTKRSNKEAAAEDPSNKYEEDVQHCGAASSPITGIRWKSSWQVWWDEHDQKMHNMTTITNVSKKSGHKMIGANQPTNHSHRWAAAGSELVVFVFGDWTWTTYTSAPSSSSSSSASSSSSTLSPILRVSPFVEIFNFHLWFVTPSFILFQQTDGPVPARHPKCRRHISTTSTTEGRGNQERNSSWRVKKEEETSYSRQMSDHADARQESAKLCPQTAVYVMFFCEMWTSQKLKMCDCGLNEYNGERVSLVMAFDM